VLKNTSVLFTRLFGNMFQQNGQQQRKVGKRCTYYVQFV